MNENNPCDVRFTQYRKEYGGILLKILHRWRGVNRMKLRIHLAPIVCIWAMASILTCAFGHTNYHVIKMITLGGNGMWDYLNLDSSHRLLFISRSTHMIVMNVDTDKVVGDIPDTPGVHGIALAEDIGKGFISDGGDNTVAVIDLRTLKTIGKIQVGDRPDSILYDPFTHRVFTFNGGSSNSTVIDARTDKVVGTAPLDARPEAAVSNDKGLIFVNIPDKAEIQVFDAKSLATLHAWSVSPGDGGSGLAIDEKHDVLFSTCRNHLMVVMDGTTGRILATPEIGAGPDAAIFDPMTQEAFSSNGMDGTLSVIKRTANGSYQTMETIPTEKGARTMALDAKTHAIYLVTAKFVPDNGTPTPPWRRKVVPDTFTVLEVGR